MRQDLHSLLAQEDYGRFRKETAEWLKAAYRKSLDTNETSSLEKLKDKSELHWDFLYGFQKAAAQKSERQKSAKKAIGAIFENLHRPAMMKAGGVTTTLGFNFYDLRGPVNLLYPVNTPFRNSMPRHGKVNAGFGTAAHWMATRNPGFVYAGVSEGNRNAFGTPDNNQYMATYKGLGGERDVTFEAQWASEGFTDNLADEHIRGLHALFLQEEGMILNGNSGDTVSGGFRLGTASTPTIALNTVSSGGFSGSTKVSVACVYLTAMGNPNNIQYGYLPAAPTVASGLTPNFRRINADGSADVINGGISAISAVSSVVTCDATHQTATATVASKNGVFGYAWYVNTTDASAPTLANSYLYAITQFPTVTITAVAAGTQSGAATGLNVDNSYNTLDFNGLLTFTASTAGAYYKDLAGTSLTSQKNGRVTELETALQTIFDATQAPIEAIWGSSDAVECLNAAVRYSGTSATGYQIQIQRDSVGNIIGGFVVSGYQSPFAVANPMGANVIPIRIHPMVPKGTLWLDSGDVNPYPQSRAPFVRGLLERRSYYSMEWPVTSRQWTFGTYVDEVMAHYLPWISGIITGISSFVGN